MQYAITMPITLAGICLPFVLEVINVGTPLKQTSSFLVFPYLDYISISSNTQTHSRFLWQRPSALQNAKHLFVVLIIVVLDGSPPNILHLFFVLILGTTVHLSFLKSHIVLCIISGHSGHSGCFQSFALNVSCPPSCFIHHSIDSAIQTRCEQLPVQYLLGYPSPIGSANQVPQ